MTIRVRRLALTIGALGLLFVAVGLAVGVAPVRVVHETVPCGSYLREDARATMKASVEAADDLYVLLSDDVSLDALVVAGEEIKSNNLAECASERSRRAPVVWGFTGAGAAFLAICGYLALAWRR